MDGIAAMPRNNPYAGEVSALPPEDFELLCDAVLERRCRDEIGFGTFAEAAALYRGCPDCPACHSDDFARWGISGNGLQRYRCRTCGVRYNSLTGTVLEHSKSDLATWVDFIRLMRFNVPLDAIAEVCRVSHQTAWEWRHRLFEAVDGYQDRLLLRDRVWIDETYITDTDLSYGFGEARKRGLSKQKACIALAIDVHKNPIAKFCGHGKPSSKRIKDALEAHIAKGATVVGDKERAHNALVKAVKGTHEAYKADTNDPIYLERVAMVNNLCAWLKRYLWRFTGMEKENLQSYLNWYVYLFRVKQGHEKWPEIARVVRHLLMTEGHFRSIRKRKDHPSG